MSRPGSRQASRARLDVDDVTPSRFVRDVEATAEAGLARAVRYRFALREAAEH